MVEMQATCCKGHLQRSEKFQIACVIKDNRMNDLDMFRKRKKNADYISCDRDYRDFEEQQFLVKLRTLRGPGADQLNGDLL